MNVDCRHDWPAQNPNMRPEFERLVRLHRPHFFGKRRHDLKQIADDAKIRHPEDRRLGILIDRDDVLDEDIPARC